MWKLQQEFDVRINWFTDSTTRYYLYVLGLLRFYILKAACVFSSFRFYKRFCFRH